MAAIKTRGLRLWGQLLFVSALSVSAACSSDESSSGDGDSDSTGDGDGDETSSGGNGSGAQSGDGDGDGDGGGSGGGTTLPPEPAGCAPYPEAPSDAVYVATDGDDSTGDGSEGAPYATISRALSELSDGGTILVQPGEYVGRVRLDEVFTEGVTVRSAIPYQARLRNDDVVITSYTGEGITLEGFDVAHSGQGGALVLQIQNLRDDGATSRIHLRNNIFHDSFNNDLVKVNNGARDVTIVGNMFYNQAGSDEHIDANSIENVTIERNVFFNDFAGSGRTNGNDTSSFVLVKDSNGDSDEFVGSQNIAIRANVFLNYEGSTGTNFVLLGEDGTSNFEAENVVVENNLMLGNSANTMRAPFGIKGSRDVRFIHNTIVGDFPSLAFAFRMNQEGDNPQVTDILLANNVWSDPTGTMEDFSDTPPDHIDAFTLINNAYYNGGDALPEDGNELINPSDDNAALVGDPGLDDPASVTIPRWDPDEGQFADGSGTICEVHRKLAEDYAAPSGTFLVDQADADHTSETDILGRPRTSPDVGAWEVSD